ncbi:hypothetical protein [Tianweitania sediminis]|uniref:Uncharacterized protein n=1 Tax=Tianweitania sediminis TaxID=1502156 RepID=A0A8J7R3U2_9HYPH|nr:hypothetical protein [Tianweitania sediminis]MBP0439555.1 hypothetical protein [Tianweitania sediminis]
MSNFLSYILNKKADWRERQAVRYREDPRNAAAAELMRRLADEEATSEAANQLYEMEGDVENELYEHYDEVVNDVLTDIGFRFAPASIDEVAERILSSLEYSKTLAAPVRTA